MMYLVEGNIGAGKSTFLQLLKQKLPQVEVALEPVQGWQTEAHGKSLLHNFYTDSERWAFTMESFTLLNRVFENTKAKSGAITLAERSIYSGYYCFAQNSYLNNYMSKMEWTIYQRMFNFLTNHPSYRRPAGFIYLRTSPEVAYERIIKRNRAAEKLISRTYIDQIHQKHDSLLVDAQNSLITVPVLTLNADAEFESNGKHMEEFTSQVQKFCKQVTHPI